MVQTNPKEADCTVCGKSVRQTPGRGRPKLTHDRCRGKTVSRKKISRKAKPQRTSRLLEVDFDDLPRGSGVIVECVSEGGKLRVKPVSPGYDRSMNVQFPKELRSPGKRFQVDDLEETGRGFYRVVGGIRPLGGMTASKVARKTTGKVARKTTRKQSRKKFGRARAGSPPPILLANKYKGSDPTGWWLSEKLDGVRAYWNGKEFISRGGIVYHAPSWFTKGLPSSALDGELWGGRGKYQTTVSTAKGGQGDAAWKRLKFMVFDAPEHGGKFEARLAAAQKAVSKAPYAELLSHVRCKGPKHLETTLKSVESKSGEGLMLREPGSYYENRRSSTLLKVKTFNDAEAKVVGYFPGKGRHKNVIGGIIVVTTSGPPKKGIQFKIGTGFSDAQRRKPPKIGSIVTYKYTGLSDSGTPKFASFLRVRKD